MSHHLAVVVLSAIDDLLIHLDGLVLLALANKNVALHHQCVLSPDSVFAIGECLVDLGECLCEVALFVVVTADVVFSGCHIRAGRIILEVFLHLQDAWVSGGGCFLGCLECEAVDVAHFQFWSVRHGGDEFHILVEFFALGIHRLEVVGCHLGFLAGRSVGNHTLVGLDCLFLVAQILLNQSQVEHTLACFGLLRIFLAECLVLRSGFLDFTHRLVGAGYFEQCGRHLGAFGVFLNQVVHLLDFAWIVLHPASHHCLVEH